MVKDQNAAINFDLLFALDTILDDFNLFIWVDHYLRKNTQRNKKKCFLLHNEMNADNRLF